MSMKKRSINWWTNFIIKATYQRSLYDSQI